MFFGRFGPIIAWRRFSGAEEIMKNAFGIVILAAALGGAYLLGRSHAEVRIVKEQVEVIRYVEKKKAEIQARPNAGRAELLSLMQAGVL